MCIIAEIILDQYRNELKNSKLSILDLEIIFNAQFTAKKLIKHLTVRR
jgi:hypothetical protein